MQQAGHVVNTLGQAVNRRFHAQEAVLYAFTRARGFPLQGGELESKGRERLARIVVKLAGQPAPLLFLGGNEQRRQLAQLGLADFESSFALPQRRLGLGAFRDFAR